MKVWKSVGVVGSCSLLFTPLLLFQGGTSRIRLHAIIIQHLTDGALPHNPPLALSSVCLDLLVQLLLSRDRVSGEDIRQVVEGAATTGDLERRAAEAGMALL